MSKLRVLIADDEKEYRDATISWFIQQPLYSYFDQYIEIKYIKENVLNEICFDQLLEGLIQLDIAFVDLQWYEEGFEDSFKGGEYITEKINDKFPGCLIIAVTKFRFAIEENTPPWESRFVNKKYKTLPKDDSAEGKTKKFFSYLEEWLISEIKKIKEVRHLIDILRVIEFNKKEDYFVEFNGANRLVSSFIFQETNFQGRVYFKKMEIANEIKKRISYPKNNLWGDNNSWGKHTQVYFKFLELDEIGKHGKINKIEEKAIYYISNLMEVLEFKPSKDNNEKIVNNVKQEHLIYHQVKSNSIKKADEILSLKDIPNDYFENLLIRYIIIGICKISDRAKNPNWKNKITLVKLFYDSTSQETIRSFFHYTGFQLDGGNSVLYSSYSEDIFFKEQEFISSLQFNIIIDKYSNNSK